MFQLIETRNMKNLGQLNYILDEGTSFSMIDLNDYFKIEFSSKLRRTK